MTSIFRDERYFIPTAIFTPQFFDYDSCNHNIITVTDIQNKPNIALEKNDVHLENNQSVNALYESAYLEFKRLYKNDDDKPNISDDSDDLKKTFNQLAEKRLFSSAEADYNVFIAKRDGKIKAEQERLKKLDEYNQKLVNKTIEAKIRDAEKKRRRQTYLENFMGLLLGDKDDPSIPKPILGILTAYHPGFLRLWRLTTYRVDAVAPISRVIFGYGGSYYAKPPKVSIKCNIKPRKQIVFSGIYRKWSQQFVRKIIEKRQRGPPLYKGIL